MASSKLSSFYLSLVSFVVICGALTFSKNRVVAQIIPDATLGTEGSIVTHNGAADIIQGGATRGTNLFHSFEQLSVLTGHTAYFNNALSIQNIISRVTGSSISNIDGLIKANGTANLFLLNPNGFIFGRNASLNIGGSFLASTASSLKFADGTQFSATSPQTTPLLTISVPIGLQFGANPGGILVQGDGQGLRQTSDLIDTTAGLHVQPNQTLALVGGDIDLEGGTLKTAGGRIELGSVAGPGLVSLTPIEKGWALGYEGLQNFRDIKLSQQAAVDASGKGAGDIYVRGRRVTLQNGSASEASTLGKVSGGTLAMTASDSIELSGESADGTSPTALFAQVYPGATGAGGNLTIKTERLVVQNGARITTDTYGKGQAASLTVSADDSVKLIGRSPNGFFSGLYASTRSNGAGAGGKLTIETGRLILEDEAQIFSGTDENGSGGSLAVSARDSIELIGRLSTPYEYNTGLGTLAAEGSTGTGGDLTLETRRLIVRDGAVVSAGTLGKGQGGSLLVKADSVELSGTSGSGFPSRLSARSTTAGRAGDLTIKTGQLTVHDGAQVTARNDGIGNAGTLNINANSINLDNKGAITASTAGGAGGDIFLNVPGQLNLDHNSIISATAGGQGKGGNITIDPQQTIISNGSGITVNSTGTGNAGQLKIFSNNLTLNNGGFLSANTNGGEGGNIFLNARNLQLRYSSLFTTDAQGSGNGGNITINTGTLAALESSPITANAYQGRGGNIQITAQGIFRSPDSPITASSRLGINGTVQINTPYIDLARAAGIPVTPPQTPQVGSVCSGRSRSGASSLVYTGTGGTPPSSSDPLSSSTGWHDNSLPPQVADNLRATEQVASQPGPFTPVTGWIIHPDGTMNFTYDAAGSVPYSSTACHQANAVNK